MHVLHIASGDFFSSYGGGQVYVQNICAEMAQMAAIKVSVLSFVERPTGAVRHHNGCDIYECGETEDMELGRLVKDIAPDIIHAHSRKAQICRIGETLNIPVVVTAHHGGIVCPAGTLMNTKDEICQVEVCHKHCLKCCLRNIRTGLAWYPLMQLLPQSLYIRIGRLLKRLPFILFVTPIGDTALSIQDKQEEWQTIIDKCTLMIAPSEKMKEAMVRNGLDVHKVRVIPHGIPLPNKVPPFPSTENGLKFFYVGRICYVKGLHILLEAFHRVNNAALELHLIGGAVGKELIYKKQLESKYKDDHRIIWHDKIAPNEVFNTIKDFHISSSSAYLEVFGLNIAESLAMGKPVLATRSGGAEMQIEDGVNGWLVPPNDVEAMRKKMEEIIRQPVEHLSRMAEAIKLIDISNHCIALTKVYINVLGCHSIKN